MSYLRLYPYKMPLDSAKHTISPAPSHHRRLNRNKRYSQCAASINASSYFTVSGAASNSGATSFAA